MPLAPATLSGTHIRLEPLALARIGAVEEGIFRQHLIAASGRRRDRVYFSILDSEWPAVKAALAGRLRPGRAV